MRGRRVIDTSAGTEPSGSTPPIEPVGAPSASPGCGRPVPARGMAVAWRGTESESRAVSLTDLLDAWRALVSDTAVRAAHADLPAAGVSWSAWRAERASAPRGQGRNAPTCN